MGRILKLGPASRVQTTMKEPALDPLLHADAPWEAVLIVDPAEPLVEVAPAPEQPAVRAANDDDEFSEDFQAYLRPLAELWHSSGRGPWAAIKVAWCVVATPCEWVFGVACLIVGLAILASLPLLQLLSLGYLLEVGGRLGRTSRRRHGATLRQPGWLGLLVRVYLIIWRPIRGLFTCLIGVREAARIGGMVLGVWLTLLPLRAVAALTLSAEIIDPAGAVAQRWRLGLTMLTVAVAAHLAIALMRGGKLRHFLFPIALLPVDTTGSRLQHLPIPIPSPVWLVQRLLRGGYYAEARDSVWNFFVSLRPLYYLWLGFFGFVGSLAWLFLPISFIALGRLIGQQGTDAAGGIGFLVGFAGALQLMFVILQLPLLQLRFAAEKRISALFEWDAVLRDYCRAPWAYGFAFVLTLLFALPLYLLKIEVLPRETTGVFTYPARLLLLEQTLLAHLPELVFVAFILPARLLTGWAYAHAVRRDRPRHWFFIGTGIVPMLATVAFYVLFVFVTQYTSWHGIWSLYEQHAFLLPVPFVGL